MTRCIICGSRMIQEVERVICGDDECCDHCHERDCNQCEQRYQYGPMQCPMCGGVDGELDSHFIQCSLCKNMYLRSHIDCPYCKGVESLANILRKLFPWQNDRIRHQYRDLMFRYIHLRDRL